MEFIKGMDISFLMEVLERGLVFKDETGKEREIFDLLKENGVNSIRLRIWNEPSRVPESGGYCDLAKTIEMAQKIKSNGMSFFLDFHYSDWWADPGKQTKPFAWKDLSFDELVQAVYEYTREVLTGMKQADVLPDYIQIGNEIRSGMLFPDGEVPHFDRLVPLVNSGIRAVRDFDQEVYQENRTKVVIHLDQGGRFFYLRDWFDQVLAHGLDEFDVIGISYYPFWHGTFAEFKDSMNQLVKRYGKPIIVVETAHGWRNVEDGFVGKQQEQIIGFPSTPEGQKQVMDLVFEITAAVDQGMGIGIYYWESAVIPIPGEGGWWSNMGVFDEEGKAMPALKTFLFNPKVSKGNTIAKIYQPEIKKVLIGREPSLPKQVKVLYYKGSTEYIDLTWEPVDTSYSGLKTITGMIEGIPHQMICQIEVVDQLEENYNHISNGDFQGGLDGWDITKTDERVKVELHPEFIDPFPAPPIYNLYVESPVNFSFQMKREINGLLDGKYSLSIEYRGTNTTGVEVNLFALVEDEGAEKQYNMEIFPGDEDWIRYQVDEFEVRNGNVVVGLSIAGPPIYGKVRDIRLVRLEDSAGGC